MCRKDKEPASSSVPAGDLPSDKLDTFANEKAKIQYGKLMTRAIHWERKLDASEQYASIIHDRIAYYQWTFIEQDPMEIDESIVREFYENLLSGDAETVFLRGRQLDTFT
ncbi:hypothetical protein AHAS_Ahas13G0310000 [Arachis hypogaea]